MLIFISLPATICVNAEEITTNSYDYSTIVGDMTVDEFFALSFNEQLEIVDRCYELTYPNNNSSNSSARYKSSEDDPTHQYIATLALSILSRDKGFWLVGTEGVGVILRIALLASAPDNSEDESYTLGNLDHFYVISTGKGFLGGKSSNDRFIEYYNKAVTAQKSGDNYLAAEHLGRALHYVQDASVPHHTVGYTSLSHANYEAFCAENCESYLEDLEDADETNTLYQSIKIRATSEIVSYEANYSNGFLDSVDNSLNKSKWENTARHLMKRSTNVSAAIMYKFAVDSNLTLS